MNPNNNYTRQMHFKAAQIAGVELSESDMEQINAYTLSPLRPEDVFAFKVSMAANEIDRDNEVFPRATLVQFANLFVGKTVIKDHQHVSDNQIARIYATNLVESDPMRATRTGEVYTELIAKCYMVKTASNSDLIAEIQAGIRKEVSLGCRIGKAVCSICETDNVKQYCMHFPGKAYEGETCYFSLEDPTDAYELSFVAIPAQQHAGTVKSYGESPCSQAEVDAQAAAMRKAEARRALQPQAEDSGLTVNPQQAKEGQAGLTVNPLEDDAEETGLTVNPIEDAAAEPLAEPDEQEPCDGSEDLAAGEKEEPDDGCPDDGGLTVNPPEEEPGEGEAALAAEADRAAEEEAALQQAKEKQANARLRALELAISIKSRL